MHSKHVLNCIIDSSLQAGNSNGKAATASRKALQLRASGNAATPAVLDLESAATRWHAHAIAAKAASATSERRSEVLLDLKLQLTSWLAAIKHIGVALSSVIDVGLDVQTLSVLRAAQVDLVTYDGVPVFAAATITSPGRVLRPNQLTTNVALDSLFGNPTHSMAASALEPDLYDSIGGAVGMRGVSGNSSRAWEVTRISRAASPLSPGRGNAPGRNSGPWAAAEAFPTLKSHRDAETRLMDDCLVPPYRPTPLNRDGDGGQHSLASAMTRLQVFDEKVRSLVQTLDMRDVEGTTGQDQLPEAEGRGMPRAVSQHVSDRQAQAATPGQPASHSTGFLNGDTSRVGEHRARRSRVPKAAAREEQAVLQAVTREGGFAYPGKADAAAHSLDQDMSQFRSRASEPAANDDGLQAEVGQQQRDRGRDGQRSGTRKSEQAHEPLSATRQALHSELDMAAEEAVSLRRRLKLPATGEVCVSRRMRDSLDLQIEALKGALGL